jgi:hypothetical protein
MRIIVYKTSDGRLFEDEKKSLEHQNDLLGEALDNLLPNDDKGRVTQADRFNLLTKMISDPLLNNKITSIYHILEHMNNHEEEEQE